MATKIDVTDPMRNARLVKLFSSGGRQLVRVTGGNLRCIWLVCQREYRKNFEWIFGEDD